MTVRTSRCFLQIDLVPCALGKTKPINDFETKKTCYMKRIFLLTAAAAACFLLSPEPASAQTFVCPNGPGPGQVQVGVEGGSHGIAAIPICASSGEAEPEADRPRSAQPIRSVLVNSNVAVAWHSNGCRLGRLGTPQSSDG